MPFTGIAHQNNQTLYGQNNQTVVRFTTSTTSEAKFLTASKLTLEILARGYNGTGHENSQYEVVSSRSITHRCQTLSLDVHVKFEQKEAHAGASFCSPALRSTAVAPRRPALPSLGDSERGRRSRSQPRPRCPGSAALRSNFLPTSWSAPREPTPESSLLGRSRPRASARRPSRRSMCGRACTHVRGPVREVGWLLGRLGRLNSSRTRVSAAAKRAQSTD